MLVRAGIQAVLRAMLVNAGAVRIAGLVVLTALLVSLSIWGTGSLLAQTTSGATLTVLRGSAAVQRADGTPVSPAASGMVIAPGDRVATLARSSALVTFFDGSEVELGADTAIVVQELASAGGRTTITLESVFGATIHRVVSLTDPGSSYRVEAGGSVALVRGTIFGHYYDPATGDVTLAVSDGEVQFPDAARILRKGERGTSTSRGDFQSTTFDPGGSLFNAVSQPVTSSNPSGSENPGQATGSQAAPEQPERDQDEQPERSASPQALTPRFFLTVGAAAGTTRLEVNSTEGLRVGDTITINPGQPNQETVTILGFGSILTTPLQFDHQAGEPIVLGGVPGNPSPTATPTPTATLPLPSPSLPTGTPTPTATLMLAPSATPTNTPTATPTSTLTATPTATVTPTTTATAGAAVILVNSGNDADARDGELTLREAVEIANGTLAKDSLTAAEQAQVVGGRGGASVADSIAFDPAVTTVTLTAALPSLSGGGDTISGSGTVTVVGVPADTFDCFTIASSDNLIRGLVIRDCSIGIRIASGTNNTIGGVTSSDRNVLGSHSLAGISIESGANTVTGNYVGTNAAGAGPDGNFMGISISGTASGNVIGGTAPGAGNLISGNALTGISIASGTQEILGNLIGTNVDGTAALANGGAGILLNGGTGHQIGNATAAGRNVISGNQHGIQITSATGTVIQGNFIGTNLAGTAAIANALNGIALDSGANGTVIGLPTTTDAQRNVISGNTMRGISANAVTGLVVEGNFVGLAADGQAALANLGGGIKTTNATSPRIGGDVQGAGNYVSGNGNVAGTVGEGIHIVGPAGGATIQGNRIGLTTQVAGPTRPNKQNGILIDGSPNATIGGSVAARNFIGGSGQASGISVIASATNATIQSNYIGTLEDGQTSTAMLRGIVIGDGTADHLIGGTDPSLRNVISGNTEVGIRLDGSDTRVLGNYIGIGANGSVGGNGIGIDITGADNEIGAGISLGANVIGNSSGVGPIPAIRITSPDAARNIIDMNIIGLRPDGMGLASNTGTGILLVEAAQTEIRNNVISGNNEHGIRVSDASATKIYGNKIGVGLDGNTPFGNLKAGIRVDSQSSQTDIGVIAGNVISDNGEDGIVVTDQSTSTTIAGNIIGLNAAGDTDVGNDRHGIYVDTATTVTIGGSAAPARNVIAGNNGKGIWLAKTLVTGTTSGSIQGNYIGTDLGGTLDRGNTGIGIHLDGVTGITVGGFTSDAGNLISGNGQDGIRIDGNISTNHVIHGNRIGVASSSDGDLGNDGIGISINGASAITIGPLDPAVTLVGANVIAHNATAGVQVVGDGTGATAQNVQIRGNRIFSNDGGPGIDLQNAANSVVPPASVPAPVLNVDNTAGDITVYGTVPTSGTDCLSLVPCVVDVYVADPATSAGRTYLGTAQVVDDDGTLEYALTFTSGELVENDYVTVTLTDGTETSRFQTRQQVPGDGGTV